MKHLANHYYHVYNRGVAKQPIFVNQGNYEFLLEKIYQFLPDYHISIISYCLMPNHYHLLVRLESDNALSPFIQRLFNSYSQAFNRQQNRTGTLFEGRLKSKVVESDEYVLHLTRYIHLNPVRAGLVQHPNQWAYSNYKAWEGTSSHLLFDANFTRQYFPNPKKYASFVLSEIAPNFTEELLQYYFD